MPQQVPYFPNLTAMEYLNYIAGMKGMRPQQALEQSQSLLESLHLNGTANKRLKDFSGGMRQRVGIAATLLNDPQIIIADEPSTGLDPEERVTLRNLLAELANDHLVLLSTHIVSDIEAIAGQILVLQSGHFLYQGTPR
ncbi:ATP-binding cassette domain-containing protein [Lentilactobacillus raoultii]|uniref:ATP-binding cassette domain-containing protein n=1 Tax=Lentilactobacillus raoultii TaxID=1987503 RepID=A0ABW3PNR4_9LACO|nr:ATP-binding cassette domain-containing protein [Lentilactobacillus raoultii]